MADDEMETTDPELETEGEQTSEPSEETQEPSNDNTESEGEAPESEKAEEVKEEETDKKSEESFDQKVKRLAQSMKDKELKPIRAELEQLRKEKTELTAQVNEKSYDRAINGLWGEEVEKEGEDVAARRKTDRENWKKAILDYQEKRAYVEKTKPELEQRESVLNIVQRDQIAKDAVWKLLFPEDAKKVEQVNALVKRFEKAQDPEDFEIILESLKGELKAKSGKKAFTPDSGHQDGSGIDLKNLSALEKIQRGLKKESKSGG